MAKAWVEDELTVTGTEGEIEVVHVTVERRPIHNIDFVRPRPIPQPVPWDGSPPVRPAPMSTQDAGRVLVVPDAMVQRRRARWPYYFGIVWNTLLYTAGVLMIVWANIDDEVNDRKLAGAFLLFALTFVFGCVSGSWKPEVCTCASHRAEYGCMPSRPQRMATIRETDFDD